MENIDCSLIYISDVHLKEPGDHRALLLLDCLSRMESKELEVLVLGGDIFDFCFGASAFFRNRFSPFRLALEDLVRRGIRVIFLQGNHEFSLAELGWVGVEFISSYHTSFTLTCGSSFGVSHGDQFLADWSYKAYLALTRSRPWKWGAKLVPAAALNDFALKCSGYSRDRGEYRDLDFAKVVAAANNWMDSISVEHGIFGHFHYPFCSERNTGTGKLLSVESWLMPNLLVYRDRSFFRIYPEKVGGPFVLKPVELI